jgi:hypothetical protein
VLARHCTQPLPARHTGAAPLHAACPAHWHAPPTQVSAVLVLHGLQLPQWLKLVSGLMHCGGPSQHLLAAVAMQSLAPSGKPLVACVPPAPVQSLSLPSHNSGAPG